MRLLTWLAGLFFQKRLVLLTEHQLALVVFGLDLSRQFLSRADHMDYSLLVREMREVSDELRAASARRFV